MLRGRIIRSTSPRRGGAQRLGRERNLSEAEIAALPILARGSALRFLLTRLFDWLNVPPGALVKPKDPLEYLRKLRFQQSVIDLERLRHDAAGWWRERQASRHRLYRWRLLG